ncbi:hypothetical protein [Novosphingobium sp. PP1Y]|uniref:hypothetical protein n=1 Tax=Novosphingobium sp. PP1Y TaxID=702113 RepID=UPI00020EF13A|nr:hypothetical protein [Novosphingobium sp. PP1Y]CCA93465.1 conserved hypothetical protein [Novosphingobium sp. PP1Y]
MRVAFLFNHDQVHQIAHSLPIAIALAKGGFDGEVIVATSNALLSKQVKNLGGDLIGSRIEHVELRPSQTTRRLNSMFSKFVPMEKLLIYRDNLHFFRSLDFLVVTEKTSLVLKERYGLRDLKIIHTRHGAGDRAIGFNKASAGFDHVLCSGPKVRDRLIAEAGVAPEAVSIVGYPKFDLVRGKEPLRILPKAERTVLYNPHPSPHLSSWYRHGHRILEHFLDAPRDGLIFAPHVMLFQRKFVVTVDRFRVDRAGDIPQKFLRGDNIKIDLGSRRSADMTYTQAADIYLGDASSQIYEFLIKPRPCIFLNSHGYDWIGKADFRHWCAGEVVDSPSQLPAALARAEELHATRYLPIQEEMFAETFDLNEIPSSERAAEVIFRLADGHVRDRLDSRLMAVSQA